MNFQTTALLVTLVSTALVAGTIFSASASYNYGANPVLMKVQAQDEMVPKATEAPQPTDEMVTLGGVEGGKGAPIAPGKEVPKPIEEPTPLPAEQPVQTAAPVQECPEPEEVAIIAETNKTGEQVIAAVEENVMNTAVVEEVETVVEEVVDSVEESVNGTADPAEVTEVAETVVDVVEETPEVKPAGTGLLALLEKLVQSQDYNENLTDNERAALDAELEVATNELSAAFTENVR